MVARPSVYGEAKGDSGVVRKIRSTRDAGAGLIFVAFGALAIGVAVQYPIGSALRMGPGYFPLAIGAILVLFGAVMLGRSLVVEGAAIGRFRIKPLVWILLCAGAFAATIDSLGIIVATCILVVLSRLGEWDPRLRESLLLGAALAAISVGIFVYALSMPLRLWPG